MTTPTYRLIGRYTAAAAQTHAADVAAWKAAPADEGGAASNWGPPQAPGLPCCVLVTREGETHAHPGRAPAGTATTWGGRALKVLPNGDVLAEVPAHRPSGIEPQGEGQSWSPYEVTVRLGLASGVLIGIRWVDEIGDVVVLDRLPENRPALLAADAAAHSAWWERQEVARSLGDFRPEAPPVPTAPRSVGGSLSAYSARAATPTECHAAAAAARRDTTLAGQAARWGVTPGEIASGRVVRG